MIATALIDEVRRMLREEFLSQRKIATVLGVSRWTVNAVALGRRPEHRDHSSRDENGFTPPSGRHVRCPGCGGLVQMPCLLCYIRQSPPR